jgi:hypothetical protein
MVKGFKFNPVRDSIPVSKKMLQLTPVYHKNIPRVVSDENGFY